MQSVASFTHLPVCKCKDDGFYTQKADTGGGQSVILNCTIQKNITYLF